MENRGVSVVVNRQTRVLVLQLAGHQCADIKIELFWTTGGVTAENIRNLTTLQAVVHDLGGQFHVHHVEHSVFVSFVQHAAEQRDFCAVEVLADGLHFPNLTEELSTQCAVAEHNLFDYFQMSEYQLNYLVLWRDVPTGHLFQL